jgi:hypothetical protein
VERHTALGYNSTMPRIFAYLWFLALLPLGCGQSGSPLAPVQGRVFYRGQPLLGGTVVFTPDAERGGRGPQAWAEIDAQGNYTLRTEGKNGAVPGWHLVTIAAPGQGDELPARYRDPERSGQRVEVKRDGANRCDLHLE